MGSESPLENVEETATSTPEAAVENETKAEATSPTPEASITVLDDIKNKMELQGTVIKVELQGALVDIGLEQKGLLHISQLSAESVKNVSDVVNEGDQVTVYVHAIDRKKGRVDLTMIKPPDVTWNELNVGDECTGEVVRIEKFGVFVNIGAERPGLIHISELATGYVNDPNTIAKVGENITARVIGVNRKKKQIDLSVRALEEAKQAAEPEVTWEEEEDLPNAMELALRRAMDGNEDGSFKISNSKRDKKRRKKSRAYDDEIVSRTLRMHEDN